MMLFRISRASARAIHPPSPQPVEGAVASGDDEWTIKIDTLKELIALADKVGNDLIINSHHIWIYDDYME